MGIIRSEVWEREMGRKERGKVCQKDGRQRGKKGKMQRNGRGKERKKRR